MKYLLSLLIILFAFPKISSAQKAGLINSGELLKTSSALYDSGKYKSALLELDKISRSDTNYVWAVYQKAIDCEADSQYTQAIKYCQEGLALKEQREYEPDLYNTYGNTLNDLGQQEKALKVFDAAIAKYPAFSLYYYNKGIVMLALNRFNEAESLFQKTLMVNPYMYSAHFQLGVTALKEGKIIPAFLSFTGYLLVNPEGKYASNTIRFLDEIAKGADEILKFKDKRTVAPDDNYQTVEDILLSKIALDKAYKPIASIDDPISRQIQAVFEKLEYSDNNKDFWIQYYLPYFKKVYSDGKFEQFIFHTFSGVNLPVIKDYKKRNKKELEVFVSGTADYFNILRSTGELFYNKRDAVAERYYFENGELLGKGVLINGGKTLNGRWEFYYPAGNLKSVGSYSLTGEREGQWLYYFRSEKLKAKENLQGGKLNGVQEYYFENGNVSSTENYVNDKAEGITTTYYYAGAKKTITNYKLGKKDGEEKGFYANGNPETVNNYADGVVTGTSREYYKGGRIKTIEQFSNGKSDGPYKSYYESGVLSVEGQSSKGNAEGEWKYYFENGKIKEKRNYISNNEEGLHEEYFENGQISSSYVAKKDKINGDAAYFDKDGKVFSKYTYDNGVIKSVSCFDKTGKQISMSANADVVSYTPDGFKKAHFSYNKKGNLDGADTIFYPSGKMNQINIYSNGELNGVVVSYYLNGNKKSEINMTAGKDNGLYTSFYFNGKTQAEGWTIDGQAQGEWVYYDELGRISGRSNYLNGDLNGYKEDYEANGKISTEQKFHLGWLEKLTQYDDAGNVLIVDSFPKASGKYTLLYPGGKVMVEANYVNGDFDGAYKTYYFDGSLKISSFYTRGIKDSIYTSYYYGGTKDSEGHYKFGNRTGKWKYYAEDGKLSTSAEYANDQLNGERISYFPNGNIDLISEYKDDETNGADKKYDPEGALAYLINFENDNAKSYSYLGKDGKLLPLILINGKNDTVKAYFANGKVSRKCVYNDGVKNGIDIMYYDNGQLRYSDTASYGNTLGLSKEYYKNGKLKSIYQYVIDNANGICSEFNDKGILKKQMDFENGINNGPTKYYDENGKLIKTLTYRDGTLISAKNEK